MSGFWARCEDIIWTDGRCPIDIDIGPHDHRITDGKVGILVQRTEEEDAEEG